MTDTNQSRKLSYLSLKVKSYLLAIYLKVNKNKNSNIMESRINNNNKTNDCDDAQTECSSKY